MLLNAYIGWSPTELCWPVANTVKLDNFDIAVFLTLLWPDFPTDMHSCTENVFIKLTILVTPIKLYVKMFLIS